MAGVLHIVGKDVRRLRWLLVLWVAVLAARIVFAAAATRYTSDTFGPAFALQSLGASSERWKPCCSPWSWRDWYMKNRSSA